LGEPKQLLKVNGDILINHMIGVIKNGGVKELFVVLGYSFEKIRDAISHTNVHIVNNPDWQVGISSSVQKGLEGISNEIDAVIIFVVDQPFLTINLLRSFILYYEKLNPNIMATRVREQLVHPVLFKRQFFDELRSLQGDKGGKQLFKQNDVEYFDWKDENLLIDIDTKGDVKKFDQART
jgi:molybdenum cofactor cytidylyltransferase